MQRRPDPISTIQQPLKDPTDKESHIPRTPGHKSLRILAVVVLFYLFLLGINGFGDGFTLLGKGTLDAFFSATKNPFFGLVMGILATSIVQSSSVTTSMVVGLVAAPDNPLPLANAVPMILGANIGTTVTNTIVALAHLRDKREFSRAFAVSTCDDFYKLFLVILFLPLELTTGLLTRAATALSSGLGDADGVDVENPLAGLLEFGAEPLAEALVGLGASKPVAGLYLLLLSGVLIVGSLTMLVKILRSLLQQRVRRVVTGALEKNAALSIAGGMIVTMIVQSSSVTTSALVPLAGVGILDVKRAFPIVLGASLGTTTTALMASLGATGAHAEAGVTIALVHVLFNFFGFLVVGPFEIIWRIPIGAAERLASVARRSPGLAIGYVVVLFYGVPAALAGIRALLSS